MAMQYTQEGLPVVSRDTLVSTLVSIGFRPQGISPLSIESQILERFSRFEAENPQLAKFNETNLRQIDELGFSDADAKLAKIVYMTGIVTTYECIRRQAEADRLA